MKSVIIGAGTYGEVYLSYLQESGAEIFGFIDDNEALWGREVRGIPVLGGIDKLGKLGTTQGVEAVYCPLGNNRLRVSILKFAESLGYQIPNYIHPAACVSQNVQIGKGVYILLDTNVMPYTVIQDYVMISMGANIAHHSLLEEGVFISTGVNFGASIKAHKFAYVGIGATIMTGVHDLGENCLVGAGSIVIRDIPTNAVCCGNPAKVIRIKADNEESAPVGGG